MALHDYGASRPAALWRRAGARARALLPNVLLAAVSLLVCYLILELVFFRIALPYLPVVRPHLPGVPDILMQNTKRGYLPRDYIALMGDSMAEGIGDWLLAHDGDRNKPFHSANIIHERTGRDIVSFGKAPGGSAEGLVLRPAAAFAISSCYLYPSIEDPTRILYYFVETNDVEDNLLFIDYVKRAHGRADAETIRKFLNETWGVRSSLRCHTDLADMVVRMAKFAFQYYVQKKDIRRLGPHNSNTVIIGGKSFPAGPLFGPALTLPAHEIDAALNVFDPALAWVRRRFREVPVTVVYIPSPLTMYARQLAHPVRTWRASPWMVLTLEDRKGGVPATDLVKDTSDLICARVRAMSLSHGATFIDARPALAAAAATEPVHGPIDWSHLNERGNRVLGELVAERLNSGRLDGACARGG